MKDFTQILEAAEAGDPTATEQLIPLVYHELRKVAANQMANEVADQTLQPTALVQEAWIKLAGTEQQSWRDRRHFFGAAAEAMRRILIDRARKRKRFRHGGGLNRVELDEITVATLASDEQLVAVDEALMELERDLPQHAQIAKLRFYTGLSVRQVAETLETSESTVKRQWNYARLWLLRHLTSRD